MTDTSNANKHLSVLVTDNPSSYNSFNRIIGSELKKKHDIDYSVSTTEFWSCDPKKYDIVHLQWPEHLITNYSKQEINRLKERLLFFNHHSIPVFVTHHNDVPHLSSPEDGRRLYRAVYANCDVVIHLAKHSLDEFDFDLPDSAKQTVISHPCYFLSKTRLSRKKAREMLGIEDETKVYLSPGSIRNKKEGRHVIDAFNSLGVLNKLLVMPGWEGKVDYEKSIKYLPNTLMFFLIKLKQHLVKSTRFGIRRMTDEELHCNLIAADVLIVPRKGLNSGVFYLGLTYGMPIVCADNGNSGQLSREYGNINYTYGDADSLKNAMLNVLSIPEIGCRNKLYADQKHSVVKVAKAYNALYRTLRK